LEYSTFEPVQVALRLVGAFYAFAGVFVVRAALMSRLLDRAIAAIAAQEPNQAETAREVWLLTQSFLILAGGAALMLLLEISVWLFAAAALGQATYLYVLAPRFLDAKDPPDPDGRRQTRNAYVVYLAATAFVVWAASVGRLVGWDDVPWQATALLGAAVAGYSAMSTWRFFRLLEPAGGTLAAMGADAGPQLRHPSQSRRIKVMADHGCDPLWALDDGLYGSFAPEEIALSSELAADLTRWADAFSCSLNPDDPASSTWTEAQFAAHEEVGRRLAIRIARERPDLEVFYHTRAHGVLEVGASDEP